MKLKSLSTGTDEFLIMVYPYDEIHFFVVYQRFCGECARIVLENITNETRETIYLAAGEEFH